MFIFSNLATSLDGKIATRSRELFPLGTPYDRKHMLVLRKKCDAILMGASTLRAWRRPCLAGKKELQPINVVVSSRLEGISPSWPFFKDPKLKRILFFTEKIPAAKLTSFEKSSEVIRLAQPSKNRPLAKQIVQVLRELKVKRLLVEGGGGIMWDFVSHNLLDELHLTLTPRILGGIDSPTLVDGRGFEPHDVVNYRLERCKRLQNELYLTYTKTSHRGK